MGRRPRLKSPYEIVGQDVLVSLTKGYSTWIDLVDLDLTERKWGAVIGHTGRIYAQRIDITPDRKRVVLKLHAVILERVIGRVLAADEVPDHVDNDPLNNRRSNLRLATRFQNQFNARTRPDNTSGYRGVSFHKLTGRWQAQIQAYGKQIYLGLFDTRELARQARIEAAQKYHGEFNNG